MITEKSSKETNQAGNRETEPQRKTTAAVDDEIVEHDPETMAGTPGRGPHPIDKAKQTDAPSETKGAKVSDNKQEETATAHSDENAENAKEEPMATEQKPPAWVPVKKQSKICYRIRKEGTKEGKPPNRESANTGKEALSKKRADHENSFQELSDEETNEESPRNPSKDEMEVDAVENIKRNSDGQDKTLYKKRNTARTGNELAQEAGTTEEKEDETSKKTLS